MERGVIGIFRHRYVPTIDPCFGKCRRCFCSPEPFLFPSRFVERKIRLERKCSCFFVHYVGVIERPAYEMPPRVTFSPTEFACPYRCPQVNAATCDPARLYQQRDCAVTRLRRLITA